MVGLCNRGVVGMVTVQRSGWYGEIIGEWVVGLCYRGVVGGTVL